MKRRGTRFVLPTWSAREFGAQDGFAAEQVLDRAGGDRGVVHAALVGLRSVVLALQPELMI
ncbi:hypothetical protein [Streptomyces sp. NPDC057909]|uniref:hypothetical protein n=1 Tax=Streptomyces sp. NPDC057909 TaxID=3346277 RepID=UPI0036E730FB